MSTDIDGTPLLLLRPDKVVLLMGMCVRAAPLFAHEQELLDQLTKFACEAVGIKPSSSRSPSGPPPASPA
jgi:hypothetical protein